MQADLYCGQPEVNMDKETPADEKRSQGLCYVKLRKRGFAVMIYSVWIFITISIKSMPCMAYLLLSPIFSMKLTTDFSIERYPAS